MWASECCDLYVSATRLVLIFAWQSSSVAQGRPFVVGHTLDMRASEAVVGELGGAKAGRCTFIRISDGRASVSLIGVHFCNAGGVTEQYDLRNPPKDLFKMMRKASERNSMMSCSINPGEVMEERLPSGLVAGHAYSITAVKLVYIERLNGMLIALQYLPRRDRDGVRGGLSSGKHFCFAVVNKPL